MSAPAPLKHLQQRLHLALWLARLLHWLPLPKAEKPASRRWLWLLARHYPLLASLPESDPLLLHHLLLPLKLYARLPSLLRLATDPAVHLPSFLQEERRQLLALTGACLDGALSGAAQGQLRQLQRDLQADATATDADNAR